jgi:uncharacterized protein YukE
MKGIFLMATSQVFGDFEPMGADAQQMQSICDQQNASMQQLGSLLEGLGASMQGSAGTAMQNLGMQLKDEGTQIATMYNDHSTLMQQNVQAYDNQEQDNMNLLSSIAAMH